MEDKLEKISQKVKQKEMENVTGHIKLEKAIKNAQYPSNRSFKKKEEIKWGREYYQINSTRNRPSLKDMNF